MGSDGRERVGTWPLTDPLAIPSLDLEASDLVLHQNRQDASVAMGSDPEARLLGHDALPIHISGVPPIAPALASARDARVARDLHPGVGVRLEEAHQVALDLVRVVQEGGPDRAREVEGEREERRVVLEHRGLEVWEDGRGEELVRSLEVEEEGRGESRRGRMGPGMERELRAEVDLIPSKGEGRKGESGRSECRRRDVDGGAPQVLLPPGRLGAEAGVPAELRRVLLSDEKPAREGSLSPCRRVGTGRGGEGQPAELADLVSSGRSQKVRATLLVRS